MGATNIPCIVHTICEFSCTEDQASVARSVPHAQPHQPTMDSEQSLVDEEAEAVLQEIEALEPSAPVRHVPEQLPAGDMEA